MPRPTSQPVLGKAPRREHPAAPPPSTPVAPLPPPTADAATAPPSGQLTMFSVRIDPALRRRVKRYAVEVEESLQAVTEAALREYLDRKEPTRPAPQA